jgi:hypothetical protein
VLGEYPNSEMTLWTRAAKVRSTVFTPLMTRETVAIETRARSATVRMSTRWDLRLVILEVVNVFPTMLPKETQAVKSIDASGEKRVENVYSDFSRSVLLTRSLRPGATSYP